MQPQLIFCMVATLMVHPRIMKIHKNLPGDIFPIPTFYSLFEKLHSQIIFSMVVTIMIHHRIMKNLPGDIPMIFPFQNIILIEKLHSQKNFCMVANLMVHPRIMKIHNNIYGDMLTFFHTKIVFSH